MLGKIWKKIGLIILIIACLWNIVYKLVNKMSFDGAIQEAKTFFSQEKNKNETTTNTKAEGATNTKKDKK